MAPKRLSPLDEPPAASSSEEEEASSEEEVVSRSESGSEEEEEDDEVEDPETSADKKALSEKDDPVSAAKSKPDTSSSGSESEYESGSETEPDNIRQPTGAADANVKPSASKPMEATPATKKPRSKSDAKLAARLASKRPSSEVEAKDSKRAKKKGSELEDEAEEEHKKSGDEKKLFQRLWSEDDEIVILKGMIDYAAKKGADPSTDMNAFHDFIKKSLQINVSKAQLVDKVRRLKKKYNNNAGKGKYNPTKPHDQKAFELSKKIWGGEGPGGGGEEPKSNGKLRSNQKSNRSLEVEKMEVDGNPSVSESLNEIVLFSESLAVVGLPKHVVKKGLDLISGSKKAELEDKWKKLHVAELELYVKRTQLISEQAKFILDAYNKSSDH